MKPHLNSASYRSFESSANDLSCSGLIPLHKVTSTEKINTWDLTPSSSLSTSNSWTTQRPTSNWQQAENNINIPTNTPNST
ncbi:hypothetical protein EYC84_002326 [Monilinia fructicola]|uniref:Uncharacterized protein n=1 Tax=Monilinia fructicola TaxID=38448 RepID=A0A5M9JKF6_MONFR|nr:hypothetical protein EYC84_002326 [Monilinia fructicola]